MIEIGGRPIIWHIMKIYSRHGINDFVICLGYKGYVIKEYFANYFLHMSNVTFDMKRNSMEVHNAAAEPWRVTLVDTGEETMIGGRIKRILPYLGRRQAFCLTYGDGVGDVDIARGDRSASQGGPARHGDRDPAARPLRRDQLRGRSGHRVPGEADRRRRLDQRRLFRAVARGRAITSRATRPSGSGSRWSGSRPRASLASISTTASGSRWTRCATKRHLEELWASGKAPWKDMVSETRRSGMRILITGNMGYVGPVLTRHLRENARRRGAGRLRRRVLRPQPDRAGRSCPKRCSTGRSSATSATSAELLEGVDAVVHLSRGLERSDGRQVRGGHRRNQS